MANVSEVRQVLPHRYPSIRTLRISLRVVCFGDFLNGYINDQRGIGEKLASDVKREQC